MAVCYLRAGTDGAMSPKSTKISISGNFVTKSKNSIAGGKKITKISASGIFFDTIHNGVSARLAYLGGAYLGVLLYLCTYFISVQRK